MQMRLNMTLRKSVFTNEKNLVLLLPSVHCIGLFVTFLKPWVSFFAILPLPTYPLLGVCVHGLVGLWKLIIVWLKAREWLAASTEFDKIICILQKLTWPNQYIEPCFAFDFFSIQKSIMTLGITFISWTFLIWLLNWK